MEQQQPPIEIIWHKAVKYADGQTEIEKYYWRKTYDENALEPFRAPEVNPIARRAFRLQKWQLTAALVALVVPFLAALFIYWLNH